MNIKNITIKIYDNYDLIKDEWIAFQDISHSFSFQTYEWVSTWYSTIGLDRKSKIQIVKVSLKDEIIIQFYLRNPLLQWQITKIIKIQQC